jgi:dipeptidyl aminopeptidase/acylaminoacyl peptidase
MSLPSPLREMLPLALALALSCATTPTPTMPPPTGPAPIVDRELYFGDPELAGAQLSPDGAFITFVKPHQAVMNVWVKTRSEPLSAARPLTADKRPVSEYFWSRDGKFVLYVQDKGGDENMHLYAVDPRSPAAPNGVPEARDLTPGEQLRAEFIALPRKSPDTVLIGLNDRDPQLHDVYRLSLSTGTKELVRLNKESVAGWTADNEGRLRLATKLDEQGGTQVFRVAGDKLEPLYRCNAEESCRPAAFHADGQRVYLVTSAGAEDLSRLVLIDVATGEEELVESDPERQVDFGGADFSEANDELLATFYEGDRTRTYPRTPAFKKDFDTVARALPQGDVSFISRTVDEKLQLVTVNSDVDPGATYLYERDTGKVEFLFRPRPKLPVETLVAMKPVRITARDGVVLSAYLSVPRGAQGPTPTVLLVHGGPWGRDTWGYDALTQFLANRGYAVLQVNFRGSAGYGKKFLNLGNGQWGTGSMQHDLTDAREWLIKQGYAPPDRIAIMGGSYGGYATLAGLAFTPDLYAAGVDLVGPSNLVTLLNSIPPYWAPLKKTFAVRVGDVENAADAERLQAQSPLNSAGRIRAPLLVIQGANDPRVKQAEADQIVVAARENGLPVEYLVAPDEGHGFRGKENRVAMMVSIERFLARHLGGRVQREVPAPVASKLAAITVDVASVKKPIAAATVKFPAPVFNGSNFRAGTFRYRVSGTVQGQTVTGTSEVTIAKAKKPGAWTISSVDKLPFGEVSEVVTIDAKTLLPTARSVKQGPETIDLIYRASGVTGSVRAGANAVPVNAKADAVLAADGTTLGVLAGTLPLAVGYKATSATFNLQTGKVSSQTLEVKGEEKVMAAAGAFEVWRVDVTNDDGGLTTLWVETSGARRLVKLTGMLPQGTGSLTHELTAEPR